MRGHALRVRPSHIATMVSLLLVAIVMAWASWDAPLQRDPSHFVFMAAHIAKGHAPYWALWDTKNPLVELWWAAWIAPTSGVLSWVHASRLAECAWMLATACALRWWMARTVASPSRLSLALITLAACAWLAWIMTPSVNDDGLTLSMYHALPELGVLAACLALARAGPAANVRHAIATGAALGACVFACWFVKQTSLGVACVLVVGTLALGVQAWKHATVALATACVVSIAAVACFAWHLSATATLDAYIDGAITYKLRMADPYPRDVFWQDTRAALDLAAWLRSPLESIKTTTLLGGAVAAGGLVALVVRRVRARAPLDARALHAALSALWLLGVLAQAVGSLTYFRHYFLAALAPLLACVVAWALMKERSTRRLVGAIGLCGVVLAWLLVRAPRQADAARARSEAAPLVSTMRLVHAQIPPTARVLNWSGLLHYSVLGERVSYYPRNVWWPAIVRGVTPGDRDVLMRGMLADGAPDYAIELFEQYPQQQALDPVRLTPEVLHAWTGERYELMLEFSPPSGRYAMPARVFRRVDAMPPTIPPP